MREPQRLAAHDCVLRDVASARACVTAWRERVMSRCALAAAITIFAALMALQKPRQSHGAPGFFERVLPVRSPRRNGVSWRSFRAILPIENLASHLSVLQKTTGEALSVFGGVVSSTHARFFGRTAVVRERAEGESV